MIDLDALRKLLCERLCEDVGVDQRPDGALMLRTRFEFPDGDRYPIHLAEVGSGGFRLSDRGHTLLHLSYEHDVDAFLDGTRGMLLERIMGETGLQWDGGAFCLESSPERLPEAIFTFGQALTRVYDLKRREEWWIGWISGSYPASPAQERTREELMETLAATLGEMLEIRREAARSAAGDGYETAKISVA